MLCVIMISLTIGKRLHKHGPFWTLYIVDEDVHVLLFYCTPNYLANCMSMFLSMLLNETVISVCQQVPGHQIKSVNKL